MNISFMKYNKCNKVFKTADDCSRNLKSILSKNCSLFKLDINKFILNQEKLFSNTYDIKNFIETIENNNSLQEIAIKEEDYDKAEELENKNKELNKKLE